MSITETGFPFSVVASNSAAIAAVSMSAQTGSATAINPLT